MTTWIPVVCDDCHATDMVDAETLEKDNARICSECGSEMRRSDVHADEQQEVA